MLLGEEEEEGGGRSMGMSPSREVTQMKEGIIAGEEVLDR